MFVYKRCTNSAIDAVGDVAAVGGVDVAQLTDSESSYRLQTIRNSMLRGLHVHENEIYESVLQRLQDKSVSRRDVVSKHRQQEVQWKDKVSLKMNEF